MPGPNCCAAPPPSGPAPTPSSRRPSCPRRRPSPRPTSSTSPACTSPSTGTRRDRPSRTGGSCCAATRATRAATSRSASAGCAPAGSTTPNGTCGAAIDPRDAPQSEPRHGRRPLPARPRAHGPRATTTRPTTPSRRACGTPRGACPRDWPMARLDAAAGRWPAALANAEEVLRLESEQLQAIAIAAIALRRLGRNDEAERMLRRAAALDPLDLWTRDLLGDPPIHAEAHHLLDLAGEYAELGLEDERLRVLDLAADAALRHPVPGAGNALPLVHYHRAEALERLGRRPTRDAARAAARDGRRRRRLPRRARRRPACSNAPSPATTPTRGRTRCSGHWQYFHRRYDDAVRHLEASALLEPGDPRRAPRPGPRRLQRRARRRRRGRALRTRARAGARRPEAARRGRPARPPQRRRPRRPGAAPGRQPRRRSDSATTSRSRGPSC